MNESTQQQIFIVGAHRLTTSRCHSLTLSLSLSLSCTVALSQLVSHDFERVEGNNNKQFRGHTQARAQTYADTNTVMQLCCALSALQTCCMARSAELAQHLQNCAPLLVPPTTTMTFLHPTNGKPDDRL